jgi:uncharacterized membrane protein YfcA
LVVIALGTVTALAGYRGQASISWRVVVLFTAVAVIGALAGASAVRWIEPSQLRRAFGVLVVILGALVLWQNRAVLL